MKPPQHQTGILSRLLSRSGFHTFSRVLHWRLPLFPPGISRQKNVTNAATTSSVDTMADTCIVSMCWSFLSRTIKICAMLFALSFSLRMILIVVASNYYLEMKAFFTYALSPLMLCWIINGQSLDGYMFMCILCTFWFTTFSIYDNYIEIYKSLRSQESWMIMCAGGFAILSILIGNFLWRRPQRTFLKILWTSTIDSMLFSIWTLIYILSLIVDYRSFILPPRILSCLLILDMLCSFHIILNDNVYNFIQMVKPKLAVYWAHLFHFPAAILRKMVSLSANFLWGGRSHHSKIHLVKMDIISRPKRTGGWGLLHMRSFGRALLCNSLRRGVFGNSIWSAIINQKYLRGRSMVYWYRNKALGSKRGSAIWLGFKKVQALFFEFLRWRFSSGSNIIIGVDATVFDLQKMLSPDLISFLHTRGMFTWDKLILSWSSSSPIWKGAEDLGLPPSLKLSWELAKKFFTDKGIIQTGDVDELICSKPNSTQPIRVQDFYDAASSYLQQRPSPIFPYKFWKAHCPLKAVLFSWLLFSNRNLSWEVLQRKGWSGPSRCVMCCQASETNVHMFFQCPTSAQIWYELSLSHGFAQQVFASVQESFKWWSAQCQEWRTLFIITCWCLWKWRNACIFQDSKEPIHFSLIYISAMLNPAC